MAKEAQDAMPLRVEKKIVLREARGAGAALQLHDQISLELGKVGSASYVRDVSGREARVLRGAIGIGLAAGEAAAPPERGVAANMRFERLDLGAWQALGFDFVPERLR